LAEGLFSEVATVYERCGIQFDPHNFLVIQALLQLGEVSVGEVAVACGCTQARASQKLAALEAAKLVQRVTNPDARKSCFALSERARTVVGQLTPVWEALDQVLKHDLDADALLAEVDRFEPLCTQGRCAELVHTRLQAKTAPQQPSAGALSFHLTPPPLTPEVRAAFLRLTRGWKREFGLSMTREDEEIFKDINGYVRERNGIFLTAARDGQVIATAILLRPAAECCEIAKLCVAPHERRRGVAQRLLVLLESEARMLGARLLRLETARKLTAAQQLYKKAGFRTVPPPRAQCRSGEILMEKGLK
jgi:GNAT superfamily N-acetyltransferase/DNA-binding MarR family transcriptional regulator